MTDVAAAAAGKVAGTIGERVAALEQHGVDTDRRQEAFERKQDVLIWLGWGILGSQVVNLITNLATAAAAAAKHA